MGSARGRPPGCVVANILASFRVARTPVGSGVGAWYPSQMVEPPSPPAGASRSPGRGKKVLVYKRITVPGNLQRACDQFNAAEFFECHESIEEIWQQEQGKVRDLYKGLIQVAAAFVHISRANFVGADRLCSTALRYLDPYRSNGAMGFDVDRIWREAADAHGRVRALGRSHIHEFDVASRPYYAFDRGAIPAEALRWGAWGFDREGKPLELEIAVAEDLAE